MAPMVAGGRPDVDATLELDDERVPTLPPFAEGEARDAGETEDERVEEGDIVEEGMIAGAESTTG